MSMKLSLLKILAIKTNTTTEHVHFSKYLANVGVGMLSSSVRFCWSVKILETVGNLHFVHDHTLVMLTHKIFSCKLF